MSTSNVINLNKSIIDRSFTLGVVLLNSNMDITSEIIDVKINFSMSGFPSGYIILNDTDLNVFKNYSIYLGDIVGITVISDLSKNKLKYKTFIINNIEILSKNIKIANSNNIYKIHLVSPTKFFSDSQLISRGFDGTFSTSEIASQIFIKDLGIQDNKFLDIYDNNTYIEDYVITYKNPLAELNFLKIISNDINEKDFFMLFEGTSRIKFVPLSLLLGKQPTIKLDKSISPDIKETGIPITKINRERFIQGKSLTQIMLDGGLSNTIVHFDKDNKDIVETTYRPNEEYLNNIYTLGDTSFFSKNITDMDIMPTYNVGRPDGLYRDKFSYYKFRTSLFNILRETVDISGNLDIDVGDTLYVEFIYDGGEISTVLSGTWIVTELTWEISNRDKENKTMSYPTFRMNMTINKDCYGNTFDDKTLKISQNINNKTFNIGV